MDGLNSVSSISSDHKTTVSKAFDEQPVTVKLEVSTQVLFRLFKEGNICAADMRCLDCEAKQCVWRLMLMSCINSKNSRSCDGDCNRCMNKDSRTTTKCQSSKGVTGKIIISVAEIATRKEKEGI